MQHPKPQLVPSRARTDSVRRLIQCLQDAHSLVQEGLACVPELVLQDEFVALDEVLSRMRTKALEYGYLHGRFEWKD